LIHTEEGNLEVFIPILRSLYFRKSKLKKKLWKSNFSTSDESFLVSHDFVPKTYRHPLQKNLICNIILYPILINNDIVYVTILTIFVIRPMGRIKSIEYQICDRYTNLKLQKVVIKYNLLLEFYWSFILSYRLWLCHQNLKHYY